MAKAKGKTAKRATLPSGFKAISGFGGSWQFKTEPVLVGKIAAFKTIDSQYKDDKGKPKKQRLCVVRKADGTEVSVFESAALRPLFDQRKGATVALVYEGTKKIKGRELPMKLFSVGVK